MPNFSRRVTVFASLDLVGDTAIVVLLAFEVFQIAHRVHVMRLEVATLRLVRSQDVFARWDCPVYCIPSPQFKENVEGELCDVCKPGTIYLSQDNPQGCQPCFCFNKSNECTEQQWSTAVISINASNNNNWTLSDWRGQQSIEHKSNGTNTLLFNSEDYPREQQHSIYYWKAPAQFSGDRLTSYGSSLHYYVYYVPSQREGHPVQIADVMLEGNGLRIEYHSHITFFPRENISVIVPLKPNSGWFNSETRRPIDKIDLMRVLADVKNLYVRARYHQEQSQSR